MKLRNILLYITILLLGTTQLFAQNTNPTVTNVAFTIDGTTVTVTYDVADTEDDVFTIYMEVSENSGTDWDFDYGTATGDIGANVAEGTNKTITWEYSGSSSATMKVKILADDLYGDQIYYSRKIYNTVTIGSQVWLRENLDVGTMINSATSEFEQTDNGQIEKYCYDNDPANCETYGGLYEWPEAMQYTLSEGAQGICPVGWHIPTKAEFEVLQTNVNNEAKKLVDISESSNATAYTPTNEAGFSTLFAGHSYSNDGSFYYLDYNSFFWSSKQLGLSSSVAYFLDLYYNDSNVYIHNGSKNQGYCIRCLKD